ncbi:DNA pol A exo1 and HRDC domain containing protein [Trichuris trichiura]|uniref:DNA pol A exo1 and HRDC domain containing protein n=1 Tax=Trichuris trichiura TaxID=36087 RepID=A0A077Z309_TRITR|nr:DNA pol A exo1 and HRDC domain containing protein [Trichuris trichiura]
MFIQCCYMFYLIYSFVYYYYYYYYSCSFGFQKRRSYFLNERKTFLGSTLLKAKLPINYLVNNNNKIFFPEKIAQLTFSSSSLGRAKKTTVIDRPQAKFADCIDNSKKPFRPKLLVKHNAQVSWPTMGIYSIEPAVCCYEHPYKYELDNFVPPEHLFSSRVAIKPTLLSEDTPLTMISTVEELKNLCEHLNWQSEFAVDLEANSERSYQGLTCLMQISTRKEDYIIDPFPLWRHMYLLNEPFTNPNIVKVFHGANSDVLWLQRDFSIYVVNMFDTYQALCVLDRRPRSLFYLVSYYTGVLLDKSYSMADWRVRPLPDKLIKYAREDTHYLLYCYDRLSMDLLNVENAEKKLLQLAFDRSRDVCLLVLNIHTLTEKSADHLCRKLSVKLNHRQKQALRWLFLWRDETARVHDESAYYVLPDYLMVKLAELLPREPASVLIVAKPAPPLLKLDVVAVSRILNTARNLPDVQQKVIFPPHFCILFSKVERVLRNYFSNCHLMLFKPDELLHNRRDEYQQWEAEMAQPHDFSHISISEELITDAVNRTFETASSSSLRCADASAFSFDQKQT